MNTKALTLLADKLSHTALTMLVRTCPAIRNATAAQQEGVCAAMRAQVPGVIDELLEGAQDAPWVADAAFALAALTLAQAGRDALQQAANTATKVVSNAASD